MKKSIVFLIMVVLSLHCYAQESIYRLHPLVGDTIDKNEKFNYLLFKNINDANFKYGIITHSGDAYFLKVCSPDNTVSTFEIDSLELKQYSEKLVLVEEYYANQEKKDSIKTNPNFNVNGYDNAIKNLNNNLINEESKDRISKEVRVKNRIKGDAERYKNRNDHSDMFSGGGYVEFPVIKSKKRK